MGSKPVQLPAGSVLLSAAPLAEDGWLQRNNAVWVLRGCGRIAWLRQPPLPEHL